MMHRNSKETSHGAAEKPRAAIVDGGANHGPPSDGAAPAPDTNRQSEGNAATPPAAAVEQVYLARQRSFSAERDRVSQRWNRIANLRLVAAVVAAILILWGMQADSRVGIGLGILSVAVFVALAIYHNRLGQQRRRAMTFAAINEEAIARIARDWDHLPSIQATPVPAEHPFAGDIDLFGHASLFHLIDTTSTPMGEATLSDWLLRPATSSTINERQDAVAELAGKLDVRQQLEVRGRLGAEYRSDPEPFLRWAEGGSWLSHRRWLVWAAWLGPIALVLLVAAQLVGLTSTPYWIVIVAINLLLSQSQARRLSGILAHASSHHHALVGYAEQLSLIASVTFTSPSLQRARARITIGDRPAPAYLHRLSRLAGLPIPPSSPLFLPLQTLTFWDVHVLAALERWQAAAGDHARAWLAIIGEMEALAALATLQHDNPDWALPAVKEEVETFVATRLGHPLLPPIDRVANDVTVGPAGTFLLVTGSNMSGKSTLLRAIGVSVVLAQAGGPVCAASLTLPPVRLWTSVRVQDSLERGVSYFMAELQRLKQIVDAARPDGSTNDPRVLYLLDEILHGTNTAERQIAARRVIAFLLEQGAIGAVSTHDLALADDPDLKARGDAVHFRDLVDTEDGKTTMSFDYHLRPGVATTTNALRLMELVGLDLAPGDERTTRTDR